MSTSSPFPSSEPFEPAGATAAGSPRRAKRRRSPWTIALYSVMGLIALLVLASGIVTRYLWFSQLGYTSVLLTRWGTQAVLFLGAGVLFALPVWFSLRYAHKHRPHVVPTTREELALDQFRTAIDPVRRAVTAVAPVLVGLFAGLAASNAWQEVQLLLHPQSFGTADPVFHLDVGFYVFTLPAIDLLLGFLRFLCLVTAIAAVSGHFIYGGIAWGQERGLALTTAARRHVGVIAAIYLVLLGVGHWFERYGLLTTRHDRFDGAGYTDVHALVPAKTILAVAALIVAAMVIVWTVRGNWRIPVIGGALLVLSTLAVGTAYPWVIQKFEVVPNERSVEAPYIAHSISATRAAYGLTDVKEVPYTASTNASAGALRTDAETTAQIRLLDPDIVAPTFNQREANRRYWGFDSQLSVDRYTIGGHLQDTVLGVRELSPGKLELDKQSWVNQHLTYTHGFGVAAAYGNRRSDNGEPLFLESGVPGKGALGEFEERVYFGRQSPDYSIVGGAKSGAPQEFDYQTVASGNAGKGGADGAQRSNTFTGDGGPSLRNPLVRLLYAIRFRDPNIVISPAVTADSQILYDRDPLTRVHEVAPFLSLDSGMYPAVVDGRLVWVIDGYTTTTRYPYSRGTALDRTIADSRTSADTTAGVRSDEVNYLRNGVKATVDAYDGSVKLYAWDTKDPILRSWQSTFPGALRPSSQISSALMSHLRYPVDLFKTQRTMLAQYHVTDPKEFYGQQDFWQVAPDPTKSSDSTDAKEQTPHYLTLQMPGQKKPSFSLSTSYIPAKGQQVLSGFLAVDSETGGTPGKPAAGYGKLTLLTLPPSNPVNGPAQVQATFNADPDVSKALNLLKGGNSQVINGNLLTLPVGGGLLYVQPVYLQSSAAGGGAQYPLLKMVLVSFGNKIGFAPTLDQALDAVFGGDSGAKAGDAAVEGEGQTGAKGKGDDSGTPSTTKPSSDARKALDAALADMEAAQRESAAALQKNDWAAYGAAQKKQQDALTRAVDASRRLPSPSAKGNGKGASDGGAG